MQTTNAMGTPILTEGKLKLFPEVKLLGCLEIHKKQPEYDILIF